MNLAQVNIYKSLQDIAAGMDYLHTVGVLHGDLKGANVLLKSTATDPRGFMCKLADFGLSRVLDLDMTHISTHTYGTISYMPPELLSQGKMTRAADVYSFGMLSKLLLWPLAASPSVTSLGSAHNRTLLLIGCLFGEYLSIWCVVLTALVQQSLAVISHTLCKDHSHVASTAVQ